MAFTVKMSFQVVLVSLLASVVVSQHQNAGAGRLEERDLKSGSVYKTAWAKCVDSTWLHNLQNNIVEVPSRFQRVRGSCRKADSFLLNLTGNKSFKYGYNLNNEVDTRVLASYQSRARCPAEANSSKSTLPRVFCPTRKPNGPWISLANFLLCDGIKNCPNGEDEERTFCNYYRTVLRDLQKNFIQIALLGQQNP